MATGIFLNFKSQRVHMLPNLLLVGAAKSGTTSMANFLSKSEQIYIPSIKECRFFSKLDKNYVGLGAEVFVNSGVTDFDDYCDLFRSRREKIIADFSNDYLYYHQRAVPEILKVLGPETKIIIVLRNPVDRAFSNYLHSIREGWENLSFMQALESEGERIAKHWAWSYHYSNAGFYYEAVKAYMENFNNVKVILFEELENSVRDEGFYEFLGVKNDMADINFGRDNVSGTIRSKLLWKALYGNTHLKILVKKLLNLLGLGKLGLKFIKWIKVKNLAPARMAPSEYQFLKTLYKHDINKLSKLIDRDLTDWIDHD